MPGNRLSDRGFTSTRGLSYTLADTATNVGAALPASHGLGAVPSSLELWVEVSAGEWEQHDASTYVTASSTALTATGTTLASVVGGDTNVRLVAAAGAVALSVAEASASQAGIVSTGTQTFGGAKTFSSLLSATAGANITGGNVGIGTASPASLSSRAPVLNIKSGTTTLPGLVLESGNSTYLGTFEFQVGASGANTTVLNVASDTINPIMSIARAGAVTLGPSANPTGVHHYINVGNNSGSNPIDYGLNWGLAFGGNSVSGRRDIAFYNTTTGAGDKGFIFYQRTGAGKDNLGGVTGAGAWTLGPSGGVGSVSVPNNTPTTLIDVGSTEYQNRQIWLVVYDTGTNVGAAAFIYVNFQGAVYTPTINQTFTGTNTSLLSVSGTQIRFTQTFGSTRTIRYRMVAL